LSPDIFSVSQQRTRAERQARVEKKSMKRQAAIAKSEDETI
jgi:hypothetical protein